MRVGVGNANVYEGDLKPVGDDLDAICARINAVFSLQHYPDGRHRPLPVCVVRHNTVQSLSNNTWTAVQFNTSVIDTHTLHNTATNNHIFEIPDGEAGLYVCLASVTFAADAAGMRNLRWVTEDNQTELGPWTAVPGTSSAQQTAKSFTVRRFAARDRFRLMAKQNCGSGLSIGDSSDYVTNWAMVIRIPWAV